MKSNIKKILLPEQNSNILKAIKKCKHQYLNVELINQIDLNTNWFKMANIDSKKLTAEEKILINAFLALKNKFVDALIIGIDYQSRDVFKQAIKWLNPNKKNLSSCFIVDNKRKLSIWGDCAFNLEPNLENAKNNINEMIEIAQKLKLSPINIALLSYWTGSSNKDDLTGKISLLSCSLKNNYKNDNQKINISDNIQFDAAFNPKICAKKHIQFQQPNILWFPNLMCGNIGYKIAQHFSKLIFAGPFILGTEYYVSDLSRGATVEDIILTIKIMSRLLNSYSK